MYKMLLMALMLCVSTKAEEIKTEISEDAQEAFVQPQEQTQLNAFIEKAEAFRNLGRDYYND